MSRRRQGGAKGLRRRCSRISELALSGEREQAEAQLRSLLSEEIRSPRLRALLHNDLAVLLAARGATEKGREQLQQALTYDPECEAARANLERLGPVAQLPGQASRRRVAIVSLLFNWLTSVAGGGCAHTVGLGQALSGHGCEVKHFYARQPEFGVGRIEAPYPLDEVPLDFDAASWECDTIKQTFREAVDRFEPDVVVVTDSWSFKPHLAEAVREHPVLLRFDSQECLCPLNNCRSLSRPDGTFLQCSQSQLATPDVCSRCLVDRAGLSGVLHQRERELSQVERPGYRDALLQVLAEARAVLVNNPLIAESVGPYARRVEVVPPGVDARRFPWRDGGGPARQDDALVVFMAGLIQERFKGFHVLHSACEGLWRRRRDFRLVATGPSSKRLDEFTELVGWFSQEDLPEQYRQADICVVPSIVQEGWPLVVVEAMAAGRPVVASRIGGLQFMIDDGGTGLLVEPGDAEELSEAFERLLDDRELRHRLGREARAQFERRGSWDAIIARHYRPLLQAADRTDRPLSPAGAAGERRGE